MTAKSFIAGIHAVTSLLQATPQRVRCLYLQNDRNDQRINDLITLAKQQGIAVQMIKRQQLDTWLPNVQHQGVAAEVKPAKTMDESQLYEFLSTLTTPPLLLILDGVQDPHNLGACLRVANAAGVHAVIAPKDRSVGLTPTVSKVASGAAEVTPFIQVTNLARTLRQLREHGVWLFGMAGEGGKNLFQTDLTVSAGLVLGAEQKGLRRLTRECCDELLFIPMLGSVESLNVSTATAIGLFEVVRQRGS